MNKKLLENLELTATAVTFARYLRETDYNAFIKLLILESGASDFEEFKKMIEDTKVHNLKKETTKIKEETKEKESSKDALEELDKDVDEILKEFNDDYLESDQDDEEKIIDNIFFCVNNEIKDRKKVDKKETIIKTLKDEPDGYLIVSPFGTVRLINKDNSFF